MSTRTWSTFQSWLSDPDFVHSARTTAAALLSFLAAHSVRLPEAYWATVSTLMVMQSSLGASLPLAGRRFVGTALGAALGALLGLWIGPSLAASVAAFGGGIFVLGLICGLLGRSHISFRGQLDRTAYRYAGITLAIILLVRRSQPTWLIASHRFLEVSIGIVVGLAMTLLWREAE